MSVAQAFKCPVIVPECIPELDLSTIADAAMDYSQTYISGLTLAEACALYWKLETLALAWTASATYSGNEGNPVYVSVDFSQALAISTAVPPKDRVCSASLIDSGGYVATETNGEYIDRSSEDGAGSSYCQTVNMEANISDAVTGAVFITKSTDGSYVLWISFQRTQANYLILAGRGTQSLPGYAADLVATQDITIGTAGNLRLKLWAISKDTGTSPYLYDTGSLDSLSLTPAYYTFS